MIVTKGEQTEPAALFSSILIPALTSLSTNPGASVGPAPGWELPEQAVLTLSF